jgi:fructose-1,6-bisphosphatase/inositol monophosphatase family enzyme
MTGSVGRHVQERLSKQTKSSLLGNMVRYSCVGREYMDLALGKIQFAMYGGKMMPWDHAAGVLIVEECGGFVRSIEESRSYSPLRHGPAERILIAPSKAAFDRLKPILTNKI